MNTCRDRVFSIGLLRLLGFGLLALCSNQPARAIDPDRTMSQYVRERWGVESGFPRGPVYSIEQTPDGYLWIGTESGLLRFDGLTFHLMPSPGPQLPSLTHVLGLFAAKDGSLWARLRRPNILRYRDGVFDNPMEDALQLSAAAMSRSRDGSLLLWVLKQEGRAVVRRGEKFETVAAPVGFTRSPVLSLAQTENGDIWVGTRDAGLFRIRGQQTSAITHGLPDLKVNTLVPAKNNTLWIGTDGGIVRWDGAKLVGVNMPRSMDGVQALAMAIDRDSNLWVGTDSRGLVRLNERGLAFLDDTQHRPSDAVTAVFEDREGNLWLGSASGIERLRDSAFVTYSLPEGLPSDGSNPVFVDADNRMWFPPVDGGLWWAKDGQRGSIARDGLEQDAVYSITGRKGELWLGRQRGGLTQLRFPQGSEPGSCIAKTYTRANGLAQDSVYSVYQARDGSVWAGTLSGGVSQFAGGRFTTYTAADGLASNTVASILGSSDGAMWFATPTGLSALTNGRWRTYSDRDGLPSQDINCIFEDSAGVLWVGTTAGLAFRAAHKFQVPAGTPALLQEQILGLEEDRYGWLWIATSYHVVRVKRDKLLRGSLAEGDIREYRLADGLRGVEGVKRHRSVVADSMGRIWFSLNRGISVVDPARLTKSAAPAIVHVEKISADSRPVEMQGSVHIPAGRQRVTFSYAGLSLSIPSQVRFRYRLDGFDHGWSEPVANREAVYTNLPPGSYRFRLVASNPDGVWSDAEAAIPFVVDPLYWQTWWFGAATVIGCVLAVMTVYRFRVRRVAGQMSLRFEERLAERNRIAQELHDTLLQGFLSASMQVHVAADYVPEDSQAKPILTRSLQLMGQVIEEGRNAVRGLRASSSVTLDLEHAFSRIPEDLVPQGHVTGQTAFRVIVDGEPRSLRPLLRDDVYRIGREALINAFRHARARHVELELQYSSACLRLVVRDDGCGIDTRILSSGRDGHWGLSGMRERAERIGAEFHVWSSADSGTKIELSIPGHVAFEGHRRHRLRWLGRRFRQKTDGTPTDRH